MTMAEIMAMVSRLPESGTGESDTTTETLADFGLGDIHCDKCHDTGILYRKDENGVTWTRECPCMKKRVTLRNIRSSGVEDMIKRYTFDSYIADTEMRKTIKKKAKQFAEDNSGWFIIAGRSGSGKSHICMAICGKLMEKGEKMNYFTWRDDSTKLKALLNSPEYEERIKKYIEVPILYIDDFWKGSISDADVNLAFQILNGRYNDSRKRTIISTELSMEALFDRDEAVGGRIFERSSGYRLRTPDENYRMRML